MGTFTDQDAMGLAKPFIDAAQLSNARLAGQGLECIVMEATSPTLERVALRIPKTKVYENVNDAQISAKDLIHQEMRIYRLLQGGPVPVPALSEYLEVDGYPAMLCEYVDDDGTLASTTEIGRVAALVHTTEVSSEWCRTMVAHEGLEALPAIVQRMERRFRELVAYEPQARPWIPDQAVLTGIASGLRRLPDVLCHMDLRDANLRHQDGVITAVLDWSNALIGPSVVDVFRILEYGEDEALFMNAYAEHTKPQLLSRLEEAFLRLDAALMLALVFISEAPDPEKRVCALTRVEELCSILNAGD